MTFLFDMSMRLFVGARYMPRLVIGSLIVRRQRPEWVGEQQKLTWIIGLVLAFVSCTAMGFLGVSAEIQLALCSVGLGVLFIESPDVAAATIATMPSKAPPTADTPEPEAVAPYDTTTALVFLMEEKRLAHDVYVTLGEEWGTGIFANIAGSETTHLSPVAPLLGDRGIDDPRSAEVGVFADPDPQSLHDQSVARGSTSLDEAIQVGILIEEKDITDLSAAITAEDESNVVSVFERLLAGLEPTSGHSREVPVTRRTPPDRRPCRPYCTVMAGTGEQRDPIIAASRPVRTRIRAVATARIVRRRRGTASVRRCSHRGPSRTGCEECPRQPSTHIVR
ncbi:DUF2202 domain-containing protein [Agromyces sp. NPDC055520]